jgi:hypothetical protein
MISLQSIAQPPPYQNAAGIRAGYSNGLSYKRFLDTQQAIDVYALYHPDGFQLAAYYEYQVSPHFRNRLQYYAGAGAFSGNWASEYSVGPSLIAGGEFIFREIPLIIGIQWKPMVNAWKQFDVAWYDFGMTVLIVIN